MENSTAPNPNPIPNQTKNTYNEKLPEELAYAELGPKDKPPRKIPFIKIIIYGIVLAILIIIIAIAINLIRHQKVPPISFNTPEALISETPVSPFPTPTPNPCGHVGKLCSSGVVIEKSGAACTYTACPDDKNISLDMTRFWSIEETDDEKVRKYNNLDLSYSFEAPVSWRFTGRDAGFNMFSFNYKCKNGDTNCTGANVLLLTSITTGKKNAVEWLSSKENYLFPNAAKNPDKLPKLNIGGIEAVKVKDAGTSETYIFIFNDTVFMLSYGASNGTDAGNAKKVFDKIISSFETIDPVSGKIN